MPKLITVTDMARSFSNIVGRVHYQGETFDIKKGANIVARLSPVKVKGTLDISDLNEFFANSPHLEEWDIVDFAKDISDLKLMQDIQGFNKWD